MKNLTIDSLQIALLLGRRKMTRRELCEKTGITEANMSTILKRGNIRPKTAGIIADALEVDLTEILQLPEREAMHEAR